MMVAQVPLEKWTTNDVVYWLRHAGFQEHADEFARLKVDGRALGRVTDVFLRDSVGMAHALHRKKLLRMVDHQRTASAAAAAGSAQQLREQEKALLADLDDYASMLDTQRIALVAKLKTVFDAFVPPRSSSSSSGSGSGSGFDGPAVGLASGQVLEQMLNYLGKTVESVDVNRWLEGLKDSGATLSFSEFVAQYCSLFGGRDPDVPIGEGLSAEVEVARTTKKSGSAQSKGKSDKGKGKRRRTAGEGGEGGDREGDGEGDGEHWCDGSASEEEDDDEEKEEEEEEGGGARQLQPLQRDREDILNIRVLAELKTAFDRFAADGLITASECVQALSEVGLIVPRKDVIAYLRSRHLLGLSRNIGYYEFLRGFAALR
jgi:hypothetical protein